MASLKFSLEKTRAAPTRMRCGDHPRGGTNPALTEPPHYSSAMRAASLKMRTNISRVSFPV